MIAAIRRFAVLGLLLGGLVLSSAPPAAGQDDEGLENPVTICHQLKDGKYKKTVVEAGDKRIRAHQEHAGDLVQPGDVSCPDPVPQQAGGEDECKDCSKKPKGSLADVLDQGGGGNVPPELQAAAKERAQGRKEAKGRPLPDTGTPLGVLLLAFGGTAGLAAAAYRASKRLRRNPY